MNIAKSKQVVYLKQQRHKNLYIKWRKNSSCHDKTNVQEIKIKQQQQQHHQQQMSWIKVSSLISILDKVLQIKFYYNQYKNILKYKQISGYVFNH